MSNSIFNELSGLFLENTEVIKRLIMAYKEDKNEITEILTRRLNTDFKKKKKYSIGLGWDTICVSNDVCTYTITPADDKNFHWVIDISSENLAKKKIDVKTQRHESNRWQDYEIKSVDIEGKTPEKIVEEVIGLLQQ